MVGKESAEPSVAPEKLLKSMLGWGGNSQNWKESRVWQRIMNLLPFMASVSASRLQAQKSCLKSPGAAGTSGREG